MYSNMKLDVKEKTACFSLLDEYFNRSTPTTTTAATPSNHLSTSLAQAALSNPTLSAAALRSSGLTPAQAKSASQFGAAHAETLAPYVAASASGVYQNRAAISNVAAGAYQKGQIPQGLSTKPGGFKSAIMSSKGPMSKEVAKERAKPVADLAVKSPPRVYGTPAVSHVPPPMRSVAVVGGIGNAIAMYDYTGTEADDLAISEGDTVVILEHVSSDWDRCRAVDGREGLVPSNYLTAQN